MKESRLFLRVVFYDGTRLYTRCTSYNEVVQYLKKESVKECTCTHDSIIEKTENLPW